ncbi:hypothetical protein KC722_00545 [Candidatus Kaiserbacteria bacterium]|nr:hypothetical protein [Candidatus Kaiserbacteria bacterium]MCB9811448.1 hypothetical protein [Candidatus Nomurabacteria bacterium]
MMSRLSQSGSLLVLVLVFGSIFFVIVASFMGFVVTQSNIQDEKLEQERALAIAEAGLNYYKWYLAHNPDDTTHGTSTAGPYVVDYEDSESGVTGQFSLEVSSTTYCGVVSNIDIYSTGYTNDDPDTKRTVYGRYARPTVAEYAYIINSNVWAGADRTIIGPYHSNGGVRMDGTNNSTVSSGQETWTCTSSFGCGYNQTVDGVFGAGPNSALWSFPSTPINFTGLTVDLAQMRDRAENGNGIYIPPSGVYGYHITFNSDGTVTVRDVDQTYNYWGYTTEDGWQTERNVIQDDDPYATYTLNAECPLIFVEDKVWLDGDVPMKVSLAAADTDTYGVDHSIILNGDITYTNEDSGLLAVAEEDVLVGLVVPNNMELNGIFVAQNGRFGRNHYTTSGSQDVLNMHDSYVTRNSLTMNGTVVSNGRVGTKWSSGSTFISGFNTRYNSYDRELVDNPPPLAPRTSDDYKFIDWREE